MIFTANGEKFNVQWKYSTRTTVCTISRVISEIREIPAEDVVPGIKTKFQYQPLIETSVRRYSTDRYDKKIARKKSFEKALNTPFKLYGQEDMNIHFSPEGKAIAWDAYMKMVAPVRDIRYWKRQAQFYKQQFKNMKQERDSYQKEYEKCKLAMSKLISSGIDISSRM